MNQTKKIALFIDLDNYANKDDIAHLISKLSEQGEVIIKRAFSSGDISGNKQLITSLGLKPIYEVGFGSAKNTSDIRMTIDIMNSFYNNDVIDTYCIASNDSDFTPLIVFLKENNRKVIGAGSNVNSNIQNLYSYFIEPVEVVKVKVGKKKKKSASSVTKDTTKNIDEIKTIIDESIKDDGKVELSSLGTKLKSFGYGDDYKEFGASNKKLSTLIKECLSKSFKISKNKKTKMIYISSI